MAWKWRWLVFHWQVQLLVQMLFPSLSQAIADWTMSCVRTFYCHATMPTPRTYHVPKGGLQLVYLKALIRHGDRTPIYKLPVDTIRWEELVSPKDLSLLDPHLFPTIPPLSSPGLLTRRGQRQQYILGRRLREIYGRRLGFLPNSYDPPTVRISSTFFTRTFLSARFLLRGLFPSSPSDGEPTSSMPPIEIEEPAGIFTDDRHCPRLGELFRRIQSQSDYQDLVQDMRELQSNVRDHWNVSTIDHRGSSFFFDLADNFFCRACHHFLHLPRPPLKEETAAQFCTTSRKAFRHVLHRAAQDRELIRLQSGPLLRELARELGEAVMGLGSRARLSLLSAHDTTIAYLNSALQTDKYYWPPYASNYLIELWAAPGQGGDGRMAFVRIIYNGEIVKLPWCHLDEIEVGLCPLVTFMQFLDSIIPLDYTKECQVKGRKGDGHGNGE